MTVKIGDLLVDLLRNRSVALATERPEQRQKNALEVVQEAMFIVHKLLGEDLLRAALGKVDDTDRAAVLETAAQRIHVLSGVFGMMTTDAAGPHAIVEEALAVARGDAPLLFSRIDGHKTNYRILRAKFEALKWNAYLKGKGLKAADRQARIAVAFGASWETIRRRWQPDVMSNLANAEFLISAVEVDGRRGDARWMMLGDAGWQSALAADGQRYQAALAENYGNM